MYDIANAKYNHYYDSFHINKSIRIIFGQIIIVSVNVVEGQAKKIDFE
jgi:hypothetical protein